MSTNRREMLKGLVAVPIITAGSDLLAGNILPLDILIDIQQTKTGNLCVRSANQYLVGMGQAELSPIEEKKIRKIISEIEECAQTAPELKDNLSMSLAVAVATAVQVLRNFKC